jgi:hypothetical protein
VFGILHRRLQPASIFSHGRGALTRAETGNGAIEIELDREIEIGIATGDQVVDCSPRRSATCSSAARDGARFPSSRLLMQAWE